MVWAPPTGGKGQCCHDNELLLDTTVFRERQIVLQVQAGTGAIRTAKTETGHTPEKLDIIWVKIFKIWAKYTATFTCY